MKNGQRRNSIVMMMAVLAGLVFAAGCSSSKHAKAGTGNTSTWQAQPLTIDGSDSDWGKNYFYQETSEKLQYSITHDANNIYVLIAVSDREEQNKIIGGGLTVWVNNQAEKSNDEAIGLGYPLDSRNDRERQLMSQAQPEKYQPQASRLSEAKDYELYGFSRAEPIEHYSLDQENKEGVKVAVNYNQSGALIYEAMIPLHAVFPRNDPHYYMGKEIAVGIFIEGVPAPPGARRGGGGPGIGVGLGGAFGGGFGSGVGMGLSIGSSIGGGGGRGRGGAYKPKKIWQLVTLDKAAF